jgi:hypothetical protein
MRTVDEALEMVYAALRAASAPVGMNQRILERCASWRRIRCRPPNADQIRKIELLSRRARDFRSKQ